MGRRESSDSPAPYDCAVIETAERPSRERSYEGWVTAVVVVGLVGIVLAVRARSLVGYLGPALFGDEMGALFTARWLTGTGVTPSMGADSYYAPGFGLLLVPVELVTATPVGTYRAALLTNLVLVALVLPALYALVRQTSRSGRARALPIAAATWCSAGLVVHSSLTWSESLAALTVTATYVAFLRLDGRGSPGAAVALVAACAACFIVHSRLAVLVLAVLLALVTSGVCRRVPWRTIATVVASTVVLLVLVRLLVIEPHRSALWSAHRDRSLTPTWEVLGSVDGLRTTVMLLVGQLWYIAVASLGLGVVGAWHLMKRLVGAAAHRDLVHGEIDGLSVPAAVALLGGLAAMVAASVSFLAAPEVTRADMAFYGRYVGPVLLPVTAIGLSVVVRPGGSTRSRLQLAAGAGVVIVGLGVVLSVLAGIADLSEKPRNAFNVPGVEIALRTFGGEAFVTISFVAALVLVGLVLVRPRHLAAVALAVVLLVPSLRLADWAERNNHNDSSVIPHALVDAPGSRMAAFGPPWGATAYRVQFHNLYVSVIHGSEESLGDEPCVLVAGVDLSEQLDRSGYRVVVEEAQGRAQLWAQAGITPDERGQVDCRPTAR